MIWIESNNDSVGSGDDSGKDKTYLGFVIAAIACFALSLLAFLGVMNYGCCGVTLFSPQVSSSDRLAFLSMPAIPFAFGIVLVVLAVLLYRLRR